MTAIPLTKLSLQGYKSFARRTDFPFEHHITAIVGPNGSGKSNLADAVRWALGEQSYSNLRSQRTEDMIFHGSDGHRRLGMAQVSLTFDNQAKWLPIEFSEVTISRQADRSGVNHYLINGSRVRLRDMADLLTQSGISHHPYTIIGQGLVDRVLTLHPQERRVLIEEAAGISGFQARRISVLQQLQEIHDNLTRVSDIVREIEPRLERLERQADKTRRFLQSGQQLREALTTWYGHQWHTGRDRLNEARRHAENEALSLSHVTSQLETSQQELARCEVEEQQLQAQKADTETDRRQLDQKLSELHLLHTILEERIRLLLQRRAEVATEKIRLQEQRTTQHDRVVQIAAALDQLETQCDEQRAVIDRLTAESARLDRLHSDLRVEIERLSRQIRELSQTLAERQAAFMQMQQRAGQLRETRLAAQRALQQHDQEAATLADDHQAALLTEQELRVKHSTLGAELEDLDRREHQLDERQRGLRVAQNRLEQRLVGLAEQRRLLVQMRRQQLRHGVRSIQEASAQSQLSVSVSLVSELLDVPAHLQRAVQAALQERLDDLVVENEPAIRQLLSFLQQTEAGRATVWSLDTLRLPVPVEVPQGAGVRGRASDMVSIADRLRPLLECLLNRTLIVEDWRTAHLLVPSMRPGCQLVTLQGETVTFEGAVSGGSTDEAQSGPLTREAEWRELGSTEERLRVQLGEFGNEEQAAAADLRSCQERRARLEANSRELRAALESQVDFVRASEAALQELHRSGEWEKRRLTEVDDEMDSLMAEEAQIKEALAELEKRVADSQADLAEAETRERSLITTRAERRRRELEQARTNLAVRQETLRQQRLRLEEARGQEQETTQQLGRLAHQEAETSQRLSSLQVEIEQVTLDQEACRRSQAQVETTLAPIKQRLQTLGAKHDSLARRARDLDVRRREAESQAQRARLALDRRRDEMGHLMRRISEDLGLSEIPDWEMDDLEAEGRPLASQPPLPLELPDLPLPRVLQLPEGLRNRIDALRAELKQLGQINPDAPEEHAELQRRRDFLVGQASDLEHAAHSLRQVVGELDRTIESRFVEAFEVVSDTFTRYFSLLFEGGEAQLSLTDPDDVAQTGVNVHVRPPGKRGVRLELLSGGERALTTIALVFAVTASSPTPFCLLDEVDATLDEANSRRFRRLLERLAEGTQFIVITHNRQIVEAADTIYGLSMDQEGVSRAISLQFDDLPAAATA